MNIGRAKEIAESAEMIHITYKDESVIIQHVDVQKEMATIYAKSNPDNEYEVPVLYLIEE